MKNITGNNYYRNCQPPVPHHVIHPFQLQKRDRRHRRCFVLTYGRRLFGDISKPRGDVFLSRLEERFHERGVETRRYAKPTFTKPAPPEVRQQIALDCGAVVEALAD